MNKLIDLLNEYGEYDLVEHNGEICKWDTNDEGEINIYTDYTNNIISKKYGFIKWLVDNDKIDYTQLEGYSLWETVKNDGWTNYICLIMVLAVSDNPIGLLISILK